MNDVYKTYYDSPIGIVEIRATEEGVLSIIFVDEKEPFESTNSILEQCVKQLDEYFKGKRREFTIPLVLDGTDFQKMVWNELSRIPFGGVRSYLDIAQNIGNKKAVRAVGSANGKNKISIIVPCHRVIGASGKLTGYAWGIWRKEWLLRHEGYSNI